jgi:hypothetical protein
MKFYILPGPFRVGFGITDNHERREKDYTGAWGAIANFQYVFDGPGTHIRRLENIIKTQHRNMLWKVDDWETEWLDNGWSPEQLLAFVEEIITERHLKITKIR